MGRVFVIQNEHSAYLNRKGEWVSGVDNSILFVSPHRDVALNQLIEANAKEIEARLVLLECDTDDKKLPCVEVCQEVLRIEKAQQEEKARLAREKAAQQALQIDAADTGDNDDDLGDVRESRLA